MIVPSLVNECCVLFDTSQLIEETPSTFRGAIRGARFGGSHMENVQYAALLEQSERLAGVGSWDWNLDTGELLWSENLFRILGFEPGAIEPTPKLLEERIHVHDRAEVSELFAALSDEIPQKSISFRVDTATDEVRHLDMTVFAAEPTRDHVTRMIGSVQDVTQRVHRDRQVAAHFAVSQALENWQSFAASGENLLACLAKTLDCSVGIFWLPIEEVLTARSFWHTSSVHADDFVAETADVRFPRGVGLPGRAWEVAEPVVLNAVDADTNPGRRRTALAAGLEGALAIPIMKGADLIAVIELYSREKPNLNERLLHSLVGIGYELGHFLAKRRGEMAPPILTPRELEVLTLAAGGLSGPDIAERLDISPATVKTHFEHIYVKLGVTDRSAAVAASVRSGSID